MPESSSFTHQLAASAERLFELIEHFFAARLLVVGDLTLDEFLIGSGFKRIMKIFIFGIGNRR